MKEEEFKKRLQMINDKNKKIEQLNYEIELIKKDALEVYKNRNDDFEICHRVNLHSAWLNQPEKIKHKIYLETKKLKNDYEWLMYWIQKCIFNDIIDRVQFNEKLTILGYNVVGLWIPFTYLGKKYRLSLPNINNIYSFDDFYCSYYSISREDSESCSCEIGSFYTYKDLQKNIKSLLNKDLGIEKDDE